MWMTRRSDAFNTVFEVLTLEIPLLAVQASFGPHSGDLQATPAFPRSRPIFYCSLSLQSEVWVRSEVQAGWEGGEEVTFLFVAQRGEVWTGKCPTNLESGDASQSLYLCKYLCCMKFNKAAVQFFKSQWIPFFIYFHPLCSELSLPVSLSLPTFFISGVPWEKTEKEPRFMLEEIKVNDHWPILYLWVWMEE